MKADPQEDIKDIRDIAYQKEEQARLREEMAKWKPGYGLNKNKDVTDNVRN